VTTAPSLNSTGHLVYVTFLGAAVASGKREHISLDLLVSRLSDDQLRALTIIRTVLIMVFVLVLIAGAYPLYQQNKGSLIGALPSHPPFTQAWLYVPAIVGGVIILLYSMRDIWEAIAEPERILTDLKEDTRDEN
jgi:TRAP-type C4-dicarboxylate transport system permease small subunit